MTLHCPIRQLERLGSGDAVIERLVRSETLRAWLSDAANTVYYGSEALVSPAAALFGDGDRRCAKSFRLLDQEDERR